MGEEKVSRRDYLKIVAGTIAGLIVGGAVGYLSKGAEVVEKTVTQPGATVTIPGKTITKTVTVTVTGTPTPTLTPAIRGGHLIARRISGTASLDPGSVSAGVTFSLLYNIMGYLYKYTPDLVPQPDLATSYELKNGGKTVVFKLREGVKFQNGQDFTADDVKKTYDYYMDPEKTGKYQHAPAPTIAASYFPFLDAVNVIDDYTVEFVNNKPYGPILHAVARPECAILPKELVDNPDLMRETIIGTGPFKLTERVLKDYEVLERFDGYWKKNLPYLDKVTQKIIADNSVALTNLLGGAIHLAADMTPNEAPSIEGDPNTELVKGPLLIFYEIYLNCQRDPTSDVRVRQAIAFGVDKDEFVDVVLKGLADKAYGSLAPKGTTFYYEPPDWKKNEKNIELAKKLLADAGYPEGFEIRFPTYTPFAYPGFYELVMEQMKKIGIILDIFSEELGVFFTKRFNPGPRDYEISVMGRGSRFEPSMTLSAFFRTGSGKNPYNYSNPEVDSMLDGLIVETDKTEYLKKARQIMDVVWGRDFPSVPIINPKSLVGLRKNVKNFTPTGWGYQIDYEQVQLAT